MTEKLIFDKLPTGYEIFQKPLPGRGTFTCHIGTFMIYTGRSKQRREFNPFNLKQQDEDSEHRIRFDRLGSRVKTRPLWWLIAAFAFAILLYWYLLNRF